MAKKKRSVDEIEKEVCKFLNISKLPEEESDIRFHLNKKGIKDGKDLIVLLIEEIFLLRLEKESMEQSNNDAISFVYALKLIEDTLRNASTYSSYKNGKYLYINDELKNQVIEIVKDVIDNANYSYNNIVTSFKKEITPYVKPEIIDSILIGDNDVVLKEASNV